MARDDYYMGSLAGLDAYRGDEPAWPPAPEQPMGSLAEFRSNPPPLPTHAPQRPLTRPEFVAGALGAIPGNIVKSTFGAAAAKLQPNPHPPGSEEAQDYEDRLRAQSYEFGPEVAQMMVGTGSFAGPKSMLGTGGSNIRQPIRAYHSSPHDFEKFDASKIGTGEGAQVYGHGIYFAENPKVSGQGGEYWQQFAQRFKGPEQTAMLQLKSAQFDRNAAAQKLAADIAATKREIEAGVFSNGQKMTPSYITDQVNYIAKQRQALKLLEGDKPVGPRTYEVDIHARPEQMLNYDAPIKEQSKDVQKALGSYLGGVYLETPNIMPNSLLPTGPVSARALSEAGIPGIRYLDQGSRAGTPMPDARIQYIGGKYHLVDDWGGSIATADDLATAQAYKAGKIAPNPTSNYVVFPGNEHLLRIAKKYGLAGAVPTMGALAAQDRYAEQPQRR